MGARSRLRGREIRTVSPVRVSIEATIIESVRVPSRSVPASEPSSSSVTRGVSAQGSSPSAIFGESALGFAVKMPVTVSFVTSA